MSVELEKKIVAALRDEKITSAALAALNDEIVAAIADAEVKAADLKKQALDPIAMPDANAARAAVEMADFACERLRALLPRVRQRYNEVSAAEYAARWQADFQKVEALRDEAATAIREYPELAAKIVEMFRKAAEVDEEVRRVNSAKPQGSPSLTTVEAHARAGHDLRWMVAGELKLPSFEKPQEQLWPPFQPNIGVLVAATWPPDNFRADRWWEEIALRNEARNKEAAETAAYYAAQERRREEREAREAREALEEQQRRRWAG